MKDKFYIIIEVKKTINYINKIIVNYPKVEYVLKNNIDKHIKNMYNNIVVHSTRIETMNFFNNSVNGRANALSFTFQIFPPFSVPSRLFLPVLPA